MIDDRRLRGMRDLLWVSLPDQRPKRELYWLSRMPDTRVTAMAAQEPVGDIRWLPTTYRRPVTRFVEAGALAWARGLDDALAANAYDWVVTLELCSLVTGQVSKRRRRGGPRQAVLTWENLPKQPLYALPPYRQALASARDADLIIATVEAAADHLAFNGFDAERIRVVKPGVDVEVFAPADVPPQRPRVVFTSPLAPNKGLDTVIDAMRRVRRQVPEAELVVAGSGPLAGLVDAECRATGGAVRHAGHLDAVGVADLLRSARVFTTAPRPTWKWTEQLGLAYLEAQACGVPVVTTACGTNDEAVVEPNLLLENDSAVLAEGIVHFLTDDAAWSTASRANRARMLAEHDIRTQTRALGEAFAEFE